MRFIHLLPALGLACAACEQSELPPRGELVLTVDTDLPVPELASRLRVDLYSTDGHWFDSRDVFLGNPDAWPASFSLLHPTDQGGPSEALVRLRVFPEGATRGYRGEANAPPAVFQPVAPPSSRTELCANAPTLRLGDEVTVRRGREPILPVDAFNGSDECKKYGNAVGSAAARIDLTEAGHVHFAVVAVSPTLPAAPATLLPQVTLELRSACANDYSGIACTYGMFVLPGGFGDPFLSSVEADLEPGSYWLVTGGVLENQGNTDVTLAAWSDAVPYLSQIQTTGLETPATIGPALENDQQSPPTDEPDPLRTIDRLVRVSIPPHERGTGSVVLHGDCLGSPARLANAPGQVVATEALTCTTDPTAPVLPPAPDATVLAWQSPGARSAVGTFASAETCDASPPDDEFVCVPSGALVLGGGPDFDEAGLGGPPRTAALHRFFVDRHELTVADYRADVEAGLALSVDDGPFPNETSPKVSAIHDSRKLCTYSTHDRGREALPLTCIPWYGARTWCQFRGGDLPSSAEWEYAAVRAGQTQKTRYPWGDTTPSCECDGSDDDCRTEVFERDPLNRHECIDQGFGPAPSAEVGGELGDETPLGIVGMGGNVREWTLDSALRLDHPCFSTVWDPLCWEEFATARIQRGTSFVNHPFPSTTTFFWQPAQPVYDAGVRCVYEAHP